MLTKDAAGSLVKNHAKDTTYRYESLQSEEWKNTAMQLGINGTSYYFSLARTLSNVSSASLQYFSSIASALALSSSAYSLSAMDLVLM